MARDAGPAGPERPRTRGHRPAGPVVHRSDDAQPVLSYGPFALEVPGRRVDLQLKVSMPETGDSLPVILTSPGHGVATFLSSLRGCGPLVDFWAAHGFVVIQPTHLDSTAPGLREEDVPEAPLHWRTRATDTHHVLDHLDEIEAAVPGLASRLDRDRTAVAGHSLEGTTASMLLGTQVVDPADGSKTDLSTMTTPALVVAGDRDLNLDFSNRLGYRSDAHRCSPAPKSLLTVFGAEHVLGGISGDDASETTDENPERVSAVRALARAYPWSQPYPDDKAWTEALTALGDEPKAVLDARPKSVASGNPHRRPTAATDTHVLPGLASSSRQASSRRCRTQSPREIPSSASSR